MRQSFFFKNNYKGYNYWQKEFQDTDQQDYRALPAKVAQQIMMLADLAFKSFFGLLMVKDLPKPPKPPKYKNTKNGRQILIYTNQAISFKEKGYIRLSGTNIRIKSDLTRA
jgi:putative transposase